MTDEDTETTTEFEDGATTDFRDGVSEGLETCDFAAAVLITFTEDGEVAVRHGMYTDDEVSDAESFAAGGVAAQYLRHVADRAEIPLKPDEARLNDLLGGLSGDGDAGPGPVGFQ